jgi:hypothetical protein
MKKFLSFFAFVAIMISFAACGGNDGNVPAVKNFQIKADVISTRVNVTVTPSDNTKKYFWWYVNASTITPQYTLRQDVEDFLDDYTYSEWEDLNYLVTGEDKYRHCFSYESSNYFLWACYIEEDPATKMVKIVGDIESLELTTYLKGTLKPAFLDIYHFGSMNKMELDYDDGQWKYYCCTTTNTNNGKYKDLYTWSEFKNMNVSNGFYKLNAEDWWYILRSRDHADELFTLATIENQYWSVHGLLILPENWQAPQGVTIKSAKEIGFVWNESDKRYRASSLSFDGYAQNIFDEKTDWWAMEKAGAVFLPAAGTNGADENVYGWYWADSDLDKPRAICFGKNNLYLGYLTTNVVPANGYNSVRLVREVAE